MGRVKYNGTNPRLNVAKLIVAAKVRTIIYDLTMDTQLTEEERRCCWKGYTEQIDTNGWTPEEVAEQLKEDILDTINEIAEA